MTAGPYSGVAAWPHYGIVALRRDRPTAEGSLCAGNHDFHRRTPAPDMTDGPDGPDGPDGSNAGGVLFSGIAL
jgi:hypothetical protein